MGFVERLERLDRRVIFWALFLLVALVYLRPLGLPLIPGRQTISAFSALNDIKSGQIVMYSVPDPGALGEQGPVFTLTARYLMDRGVKLIFVGIFSPETGPITDYVIDQSGIRRSFVYGKDYVNLGFVPGYEMAVAGMAQNFQDVVKTDAYGASITAMELTRNIKDANNFAAYIGVANILQIRHWYTPFKTPLISICSAADAPGFAPFFDAGQFAGLIIGKTGGAELEFLTGRPGLNIRDMDAVTIGQGLFVLFVIIGNLTIIGRKRRRR